MKRLFFSSLLAVSMLMLSGCSLIQSPENTQQGATSAISAKAVKGSLWRTDDGGHTFNAKSKISDIATISTADIISIAYHPNIEGIIYVGSLNDGMFKTVDSGETWSQIPFPPKGVYSFIIDKNDPDNEMFASGVIGSWGKIFMTEDGGQNWKEVYTEPGQNTTVTSLSQDPKNANILFAGTSAGTVIKSVDAGNTWRNIGNRIDGTVSSIIFDAADSSTVYVLAEGRKVYYSKNGGSEWIDGSTEGQGGGSAKFSSSSSSSSSDQDDKAIKMPSNIISIASDPSIPGTLYAGTKKGLFVSRDYAKGWHELNIIESAEKFPIRSIAINPKNSREVVFVAGRAFYKSSDSGETWEVAGLNVDRDASFVSYDPFDSRYLFLGLRKF